MGDIYDASVLFCGQIAFDFTVWVGQAAVLQGTLVLDVLVQGGGVDWS